MSDFNLKEIVSDNNLAEFESYRAGKFYYRVSVRDEDYLFPVDQEDLEETGTPTLNRVEKAITLMRYIRKALEEDTFRPVD